MKRGWSARVVMKYTLLQVPDMALLILILLLIRRWVDIPPWVIWGLIALWVFKDIALFPFVWRAYDQSRPGDPGSMIGLRGTAKDRLAPSGYVHVRGELWQAEIMEGGSPIEKGDSVRVMGIRGLTLLVQPKEKSNAT